MENIDTKTRLEIAKKLFEKAFEQAENAVRQAQEELEKLKKENSK